LGLIGRRQLLYAGGLAVLPFYAASANTPDAFDIRKFGAKGDGRALDTLAIQKAINAAAAAGGEDLTNVSPNAPWSVGVGRDDLPQDAMLKARVADHTAAVKKMAGLGNKAIALKNSRNIILRDITIFRGGHFGILATGVDNLTIDNLKIDTSRDWYRHRRGAQLPDFELFN
jgi:polygalacturonase